MFRASFAVCLLGLLAPPVLAVRPFITDDARVVGRRQAQMESWIRGDRAAFQHWALVAYGPIAPLEVTVGAVHGLTYENGPKRYSIAGPLVQGKYLLRRPEVNSWPGIAVSAGAFAPAGNGNFKLDGWDTFAYAAVTESIRENDDILLHGTSDSSMLPMAGERRHGALDRRFACMAVFIWLTKSSLEIHTRKAPASLSRPDSGTSSASTSRWMPRWDRV